MFESTIKKKVDTFRLLTLEILKNLGSFEGWPLNSKANAKAFWKLLNSKAAARTSHSFAPLRSFLDLSRARFGASVNLETLEAV